MARHERIKCETVRNQIELGKKIKKNTRENRPHGNSES